LEPPGVSVLLLELQAMRARTRSEVATRGTIRMVVLRGERRKYTSVRGSPSRPQTGIAALYILRGRERPRPHDLNHLDEGLGLREDLADAGGGDAGVLHRGLQCIGVAGGDG